MGNSNLSKDNKFIFWLALCTIIMVGSLVQIGAAFGFLDKYSAIFGPRYGKNESAFAIAGAKSMYKQRMSEGMDMAVGPCLTNALMPGWVVDIVHSPREEMDDNPVYQCPAYLEGRAQHLVELDTNGNLVRVR